MRDVFRIDLGMGVAGKEVEGTDISVIDRVCWRGDTRTPTEIFEFGFRRRDDTFESYFNRKTIYDAVKQPGFTLPKQLAGKTLSPSTVVSKRTGNPMMSPVGPLFRPEMRDMSPSTTVCVASNFRGACLFPLAGEASPQGDTIWVYAVYLENGYNTYQMQVQAGPNSEALNFVQEACCNDIPSMHVLGAIKVERWWNMAGHWQYGAKGYVDVGSIDQIFLVNRKSIGCVGRDAKITAAKEAISKVLNGTQKFMIKWG